ncbi:hypothetical protein [Moraxella bovis]|uniref:Uncharacterized protein n=1 Tax=Moraxella bovis TaxID=476 RepID=A0A378PNA1_MORBO|nr:hypothetical protein [Moraxella bovis]UYZ77058.1 hypothetical protein LP093_13950 [Moraxella bovis]UYZ79730.1 hypothetical protein LP115_14005 [Moraxella bovis]UYZ88217.1 hypothetical protein LP094_14040 [Moraxella bovis]UYZ93634.1 hypothetical protein LP103_14050 [Moraxella bovis]UYZ99170.1 hypothetical protein LP107_14000 [Moraxella bovis]
MFSKEGREEIRKEQEKLDENLKATGKITGAAGVQVIATTANVLTGNQTLTQAIQGAKAPAKMAKAIQDYPEIGAVLDAYQKGEYHNLALSQEALQALSDATGISTEVLLTSITAQRGIQGGTNKTLTVIDTHNELRQDSIQTLGHELDHIRGGKNETLADLAGLAAKLNTDAAIIANQDTISPIKAQLEDGKDAQTTAQNQALLEGNDKTFVENHDGREGEWSYDHWGCIGNNCGDAGERGIRNSFPISNQEALIIKEAIGTVVTPIAVMEAYYKAETDVEKIEVIANLIPANKIASKAMRKIKAEEIVKKIKKSDAEKWNEIRAEVKPPHARHKIDQIVGKRAEIKNTVVSSRVDMNKDIELIRQGYGTPKKGSSGEMQIEINGRTYQTHAGGSSTQSNRLIPISSNKMGEIFELSRGQYVNLQEIVKHGGDIAKARAEMSRRKDFKQSDFDRAVEVYNATK